MRAAQINNAGRKSPPVQRHISGRQWPRNASAAGRLSSGTVCQTTDAAVSVRAGVVLAVVSNR